MIRAVFALPRTVWLLGLVSLFNDSASELVYPLVPIYLATVLATGPRALGIIEGISEAAGSLIKLFGGVLADRTGTTKRWVVGGYSVAAVLRPLLAFAGSWPVVLVLRFADRASKGIRTAPRDAILAQSISEDRRGLAFGLHRTLDNAGAVIGPLLAAALLAWDVPLRHVFLWSGLGGVGAVAFALAVREPQIESHESGAEFTWTLAGLPPVFRRYLAVLALFTLGNSSNMFLLLRAKDLGLTDSQIPLLWALVAFVAAVFATPLSGLSDRFGRPRLIMAGWLVYAGFYLALGLNGHPATLWPLFGVYGLFMALTEGAEKALVADLAPAHARATAFGWFHMVSGIMLLPASLLFGVLWQAFGPVSAFAVGAGCSIASVLLLQFWVFGKPGAGAASAD
jgi:MFS family permease